MKRLVFSITLLSVAVAVQAQEKVKDTIAEKHYDLQEVTILGKPKEKVALVPTQKLQASTIQNNNKTNVVDALNLLPGVSISQFGARNEGTILVRGFDNRRTPVYYDGIPIYAPYDGNFDLSRFLTYDLGNISVEKGLVSVKYGANAMGGAVNIVSRSPEKELDINGTSGVGFADGAGVNSYFTGLNVGTRKDKYYAMVSGSFNKRENFVLSKNLAPNDYQEAGGKRFHSGYFDKKISAKIGYTPNETDEYALGFVNQQANKDISFNIYSVGERSWRDYPIYNKTSLYAKTKTKIAPETFMYFTGYYDKYYNEMHQYDNHLYHTMNMNYTFKSIYNDYSAGGILTFSTQALNRNAITLTINEKYDHHKEHNAEVAANPAIGQIFKEGEPEQSYKDNTFYVGLEDVITLTDWLNAVVGASYNQRKNILAQEYGTHYLTGQSNVFYDFPTGSDSAFDFKGGLIFKPIENHQISLSASKRSRFASQKERYSSRFGGQKPNPDLKSEYAIAYDLSYTGKVLDNKLQYEVSGFINDVTNAIFGYTVGYNDRGRVEYNINIGKALFQGFEAGFGYAPVKYFTLGANYSFIEMKDRTKNSNNKFVDVPKYKIVGFATISVPEIKTQLYVNTETYGKRYLNSQGTQEAPDFTLVNAKLNVKLYKGLDFNFGVNNLLDRDYYWSYGFPQAGRNFLTGVSYNF